MKQNNTKITYTKRRTEARTHSKYLSILKTKNKNTPRILNRKIEKHN